ncbi:2-amino-3-ketobutyrate coenzyme A ligase, mitochondrial-like isoform X1 [Schistocerca gregaria]|uniref:2-amino-3-ketobutyrate coenzyme A ligase, mitochondrial-like isoform X1 n=1 Tax=Schistocerca gregaria TaxID=7010 RepID=UPI00211EEA35|nr:2-amino-3-ketobutyrate coenzyme A ligase, mitochondrial-like isoform X1 [Schistocerca gregaria]
MTSHHVKNLMFSFKHRVKSIAFLRGAHSDAAAALKSILCEELKNIKDADAWKQEHVLTSSQKVPITIEGQKSKILNFCSHNYLGLATHPDVICAAKAALDEFGAGLASVRFISGTHCLHKELEAKLAKFHCRESALLYINCFSANAGFFEALLKDKDAVFYDELSHPSTLQGIRLCCAQKCAFKHNDMADLEQNLQQLKCARLKVIATCGVFPMDADVAPLTDIYKLAQKYGALMYLDDSNATGFIGKTGRGTEELCGMMGVADVITSTLGKALGGGTGGYTAGSKELICFLRQCSRTYLFTNAIPPSSAAAGIKALDLVINDGCFISRVLKNTERFRCAMVKAGFRIAGENHPICPVMLCDAKLAHKMAAELLCKGILVPAFTHPLVPKDKPRIRVQISAEHCDEDIDKAVCAFTEVGKSLNIIK